jgi:hemerythrin
MFFQWSDKLNTGIEEIDNQHRSIAFHINSLYMARQENDLAQVGEVLAALSDYTINHFSFEEQLMEEAGYSYLNSHRRVHQIFIKRITEYQQRFHNGEDVTAELLNLLKGWLGNHIEHEDRDYLATVKLVTENQQKHSWIKGLVSKVFG